MQGLCQPPAAVAPSVHFVLQPDNVLPTGRIASCPPRWRRLQHLYIQDHISALPMACVLLRTRARVVESAVEREVKLMASSLLLHAPWASR